MNIYCCGCNQIITARLTNGREIYPHRNDLRHLPFWICNTCKNYVGCHHKTKNRTHPLGYIPTKELRKARTEIHKILDPIWKSGQFTRKELYQKITDHIGWKFHTAKIKNIDEARIIYKFILELK